MPSKKIIVLRNSLRVLGIASAVVAALSFGAGIAKASISVGGGNGTTGPNSENENEWNIDSDIHVDISNHSTADNGQSFVVDTGKTKVDQNTKVEDITTGNVWGDIVVDNSLNTGDIALMSMDPGDISVTLANGTTGPNSKNENEISVDTNRNIDIWNCSNIDNALNLALNTGNTKVDHNTVVGDISTGDVHFDTSVKNTANGSMGNINLSGVGGVSVSGTLSNSITGPQSSNENKVKVNSDVNVDVHNSANIDNNQSIDVNSGNNNIDHNTVVGDISTGDVSINVSTTNNAN